MLDDDLGFSPFQVILHHYIIEEANKNVTNAFMTNGLLFPYSALLHHIPRKHLVTQPGVSDPLVLTHSFDLPLWS